MEEEERKRPQIRNRSDVHDKFEVKIAEAIEHLRLVNHGDVPMYRDRLKSMYLS